MTHQYELMVILNPEIDERQVPAILDKFLKVITTDGGSIDNVDIWGKRRLAYEIQKKNEGVYAVVAFTASSAATQSSTVSSSSASRSCVPRCSVPRKRSP